MCEQNWGNVYMQNKDTNDESNCQRPGRMERFQDCDYTNACPNGSGIDVASRYDCCFTGVLAFAKPIAFGLNFKPLDD